MEERIKLLLETNGPEAVKSFIASTDQLKQKLKDLGDQHVRGALDIDVYLKESAALEQQLRQATDVLDQLRGKPGAGKGGGGGQGILGASYALQDFVSVLSGGQGFSRALASVSNNVGPLLTGLGMGAGLAGVASGLFTIVSAGVPIIEKWFEGLSGEAADKAKDKLQGIKDQIEDIHKQFTKLTETPTDIEKLSAEAIQGFLGERPHAEEAKAAIVGGMGRKTVEAALTAAGTREEHGQLAPAAEMTDAEIERRASVAEFQASQAAPGVADAGARAADITRRQLRRAREEALQKRFDLERAAKSAFAEKVIMDAQQAGPAGAQARRELLGRTKGVAGLEALQEMSPAAIEQQEADFEREWAAMEAFAEGSHNSSEKRRQRKARAKKLDAALKRRTDRDVKAMEHAENQDFGGRLKAAESQFKQAGQAARETDIDERAAILAAQMRQAGGFVDDFGRFQFANPEQQSMRLQHLISQELKRQFPKMGMMARTGIAGQFSMEANKKIDDALQEARAGAARAGLDANDAMLQTMGRLVDEFRRMQQKALMQQNWARRMGVVLNQSPAPSGLGN